MPKRSPKSEQDLVKRLEQLIHGLIAKTKPVVKGVPTLRSLGLRLGYSDEVLVGCEALAMEEILDNFCPGVSRDGHSRAVIDHWMRECVLAVLEEAPSSRDLKSNIARSIDTLKKRLKAPVVKWEVWQFVNGFAFPGDYIEFGRAAFFIEEGGHFAKRIKEFARIFLDKRKLRIPQRCLATDSGQRALACRLYVEAVDSGAALLMAEAELNTTLAVLNFFASIFFPRTGLPIVRRTGDPLSRWSTKFALTESPEMDFARQEGGFRQGSVSFNTKLLARSGPAQKAFAEANSFLKRDGVNAISERFVTAMKWAGKGAGVESREDSFLFLALALESLILKGKVELSYRLALRVAHLLGSSKEERSRIRDYVKHLYDLRSALVHTGNALIADSDLDWLRRITTQSILNLMTDNRFQKITTDDSLEDWFEESLLS